MTEQQLIPQHPQKRGRRTLNHPEQLTLSQESRIIPLIDDALIASAAQCLGFLRHALVVVTLALVLGLGKDVDAK